MVDKVELDFVIRDKQAQKAIDDLLKSTKGFGDQAKTSFGGATNAIEVFKGAISADFVSAAFKKVSSTIVNSIKSIVNEALTIEKLSTQIKTFTGSAEDARKVIAEVQQFGATTPFEFPELAQSAKTLLAFGISAEDVTTNLKNIGEAAAATGSSISEITLIFGQVAAAGKLTGERLLQLQERGINVLPQLAENFGKTVPEIQKMVSAGKIGFADFQKALADMSAEGGKFEGAISSLAATAGGQISNMNDSFTILSGQLGDVLLPIIGEAAGAISEFVTVMSPSIVDSFKVAVSGVVAAVKAMATVMNFVTSILRENDAVFRQLLPALTGAAIAVGSVTAAIVGVTLATKAWAFATAAASAVLTATPLGPLIIGLSAVGAAIGLLIKNWDLLIGTAKVWIALIINKLMPVMEAFAQTVKFTVGLFNKDLRTSIDSSIAGIKKFSKELQVNGEIQRSEIGKTRKELEKIVDDRAKANNEIISDAERTQRVLAETARQEILLKKEVIEAIRVLEDEVKLVREEDRAAFLEKLIFEHQEEFDLLVEKLGKEEAIKQIFRKADLKQIKKQDKEKDKLRTADAKKAKANIFGIKKFEEQTNKERLQNFRSTISMIASASDQGNKALFTISKAAGIAQATIDTFAAANKALASAPPPFNFALAAAVTAFGLANVAKIASSKFQGGGGNFAQGGIVAGTSFSGDNVPINVNSGELVLNRQQQGQLFNDIKNGTSVGDGVSEAIGNLASAIMGQEVVISLNERELARGVRDASRAGFVIGQS